MAKTSNTVSNTSREVTLSGKMQSMSEGFGKVSIISSGRTWSGEVQQKRSEGFGKVSIMSYGGTLSTRVQQMMSESVATVSTNSSVYTISGKMERMARGLDTVSTTSSDDSLSSKVQLGPAECDTCLTTRLVWTRPCCLVKTCLPCLEAYVEGKISDGVIDIQCPGHSCDTHLTPSVIKRAVDTDKAKRFSFLRVKSDRCQYKKACPICDHVVTLDDTFLQYFGSLESIIACPKCLKEWCFQCMVPWHEGYTCAEYKTFKSDTGVAKWAKKLENSGGERNAQQCPNCKIWIQKIAGCYSMTCAECKTRFCYLCGAQTPHPEGSTCVPAQTGVYGEAVVVRSLLPIGDATHVDVQGGPGAPVTKSKKCRTISRICGYGLFCFLIGIFPTACFGAIVYLWTLVG